MFLPVSDSTPSLRPFSILSPLMSSVIILILSDLDFYASMSLTGKISYSLKLIILPIFRGHV